MKTPAVRPIHEIAAEIRADWKKVYFGAEPYLLAMSTLNDVSDRYGCESARTIIQYFLVNARGWRGETARRTKAELKAMTK